MTAVNTVKKQRGKPFKKGPSGNPKGRPVGSLNRATLAAQELLDGEVEALTKKAIEKAKDGDMAALRLCLERIIPARKDRPIRHDLPVIGKPQDAVEAMAGIVAAVGSGEITPSEAAAVSGVVETYRRAVETEEHERRLAALEKQLSAKGQRT